MSESDLLSFLNQEEARSFDSTLLDEAEAAINSYNGMKYGDEEEGRSQVVAGDVAESTDYMLTSVLDAFVSSGRVVEFEPSDEGQEDQADDATEAMHYFYRRKSGYRLIHDWAKAGLLEKIGVVKSCVERKHKRVERTIPSMLLPGETEDELKQAGIIEAEEAEPQDDGYGNQLGMHRVVTLEETAAEFRDYFVPLEEFGFSPDTIDLDTSPYLNHHPIKTLSELVQMGYDREIVQDLNDGSASAFATSLSQARDEGRSLMADDRVGMLRKVRYLEEYVFYDLDNDGIAERLKVCRVGNTILDIEVVDAQPFEYWCPYPMHGRLIGQSLADKTMDIQRVNSVLERNMLDSLYFSTAPGTYVSEDSEGDHTLDDLLTVRPGRIVRFKGNQPPIPEVRNDTSGSAMAAIEFKIRQRESRTGITRLNKGVDEDTLNDTAKGQAALMSRGQQMERYIIRNFAEGVARLFMKKVGLMRAHGSPFRIRVDGEYREVDPSKWPEDMEVNVKVGLGSGSKDDRIMHRNMIGQVQSLLKEAGSPLVTDENIYNLVAGGAKDMGFSPNDLFTHPDEAKPQQQPQDPAVMKLQAELQIKQQQLQQAQQESQAKLALMAQQHASADQLAQAKAEAEASLALRQQNLQAWLDAHQMALDAHKHHQEMQRAERESRAKVSKMRKGGSLAA